MSDTWPTAADRLVNGGFTQEYILRRERRERLRPTEAPRHWDGRPIYKELGPVFTPEPAATEVPVHGRAAAAERARINAIARAQFAGMVEAVPAPKRKRTKVAK